MAGLGGAATENKEIELNQTRPQIVFDFGVSPEELDEWERRTPASLDQVAAAIVTEEELMRDGRWGGQPAPRRRTRF